MKTAIIIAAVLITATTTFAADSVRGYTRRDGTYVQPHMRSDPNQRRYDNFSSQGNTNPYTGERGSEHNEWSNPPERNQGRQDKNPYRW
ncbi:MAG TPA: hypothetical protein DEQ20_00865 [Desulfobulbaceae bacterium]|nr:MAG: hypothetical protein A2520_06085 [Deltaproteobacteria bacterium RIFOXYD12_FULL_53_23]HCC53468.1 hypothetical protein [Desulfobulbaceae bacterium]